MALPVEQFTSSATGNGTFSGSPSSDNNTQHEDENYTPANNYTSTWEWVDSTPPSVGSPIVLSSKHSERFQKWDKMHQFNKLMGVSVFCW